MIPHLLLLAVSSSALLLIPATAPSSAQEHPLRAATAAPAEHTPGAAQDTGTVAFEVNGLRVILRRNTANEVVAASLYLLGGTQQLTPETQGIEALLLAASERGTRRYPGALARQRLARLGSNISIDPGADWTRIGFTTIRANFDSTWAIFADRVVAPSLDPAEVEVIRTQFLTGLRQRDLQPDDLVSRLADSVAFIDHPYGLSAAGTEASVAALTRDQLRRYHAEQFVTSRMLLVVVGNIDRAHLERQVTRTLATLPRGTYEWRPPPVVRNTSRTIVIRPAALPTNYILGYYAGPPADSRDHAALRVATAVLSGRFFTEVRSRRNLSYAVEAPFVERAIATGGVYVTTADPNRTLQVMRDEMDRIQRELIDPDGLDRLIQQFITDYFLKNETNADQATFLARAAIYQGDHTAAARFMDDLRRVRPEDVRRVSREYMRNFRFAYVGDPNRISNRLLDRF